MKAYIYRRIFLEMDYDEARELNQSLLNAKPFIKDDNIDKLQHWLQDAIDGREYNAS